MTTKEIMTTLEKMGNDATKKTFLRHGAKEPFFGVKVGDMKTIVKKVKKDYAISKELFESGNGDAMYLAGLIADEMKMTKSDLEAWAKKANWYMLSEYTVAWIAAESKYGWELGLKWIDSNKEHIASTGWSTLSSYIGITPNEKLDYKALEKLMTRVTKEIHAAPNRVRQTMNMFIIAVGGGIPELTEQAIAAAKKIGEVYVDMGGTACKVPAATDYIAKIKKMGRLGHKKKMARC